MLTERKHLYVFIIGVHLIFRFAVKEEIEIGQCSSYSKKCIQVTIKI